MLKWKDIKIGSILRCKHSELYYMVIEKYERNQKIKTFILKSDSDFENNMLLDFYFNDIKEEDYIFVN